MGGVFISYRRSDSRADAGRIYDHLLNAFGDGDVFMDVEMDPGEDWVDAIDAQLAACSAAIVLIGREWLEDPRLQDPKDPHRLELVAA
ncbi:MAG: toll/interleukin-1 receptor domain-containing protein, partial [Planctomycetota bacterium]